MTNHRAGLPTAACEPRGSLARRGPAAGPTCSPGQCPADLIAQRRSVGLPRLAHLSPTSSPAGTVLGFASAGQSHPSRSALFRLSWRRLSTWRGTAVPPRDHIAQPSTAQHGKVMHGTARHGTAQISHDIARHGTVGIVPPSHGRYKAYYPARRSGRTSLAL